MKGKNKKVALGLLSALIVSSGLLVTKDEVHATSSSVQLGGGTDHHFLIKDDGSLWGWGWNTSSQLGDNSIVDRALPVAVPGMTNVKMVRGGSYHSVVVKNDGTVWAWGANGNGQAGYPNTALTSSKVPVQITGISNVVAVEAGNNFTVALKSDGTVWAWGQNNYGQLGDNTKVNKTTPIQVPGLSNVKAISAGANYVVAVKTDGSLVAWGQNNYGQLGTGTKTDSLVPVTISSISGVSNVNAGYYFTSVLKTNGEVWSWGLGSGGQLGNAGVTDSLAPVKANISGVKAIAGGTNHTVALKTDGTVWTWGVNQWGNLGNGNKTNSSIPVQVLGENGAGYLTDVKEVFSVNNSTTALKNDGTVWAWGSGTSGQLGDGLKTDRSYPMRVGGTGFVAGVVDTTPPVTPTISASTTTPTNQNVVVTISYPSDASTKEYKIGSTGTWIAYTTPITVESNQTIYARGKDDAGNTSTEASYSVSNIDKVAPTGATFTPSTTSPSKNVTVTIAYPSDASVKEYRIGTSGTWTSYTNPVAINTNDTIYARSRDAAGNQSGESNYVVSNIDNVAPTVATFSADKTTTTNGNVTVTITYPGDASVKQYKIGEGGTWTSYTTPVVMTTNGTVYARSTDAAGNTSAESNYVVNNIDKTGPEAATFTADKTTVTNGDVTVTISFPGDASVKQYKIGASGTWTTYTGAVPMTANETIYARSSDTAGNLSVESSYIVTNIDKTAPVAATFLADKTTPTNGNVAVTITYPSDSSVKQYKVGASGTWTAYTGAVPMTANETIYARSTDAAGNASAESSYVVSNIDKTAPVAATFSADTTATTNGNVNVTITFPGDASVKQYKIGEAGTWTSYTAPVVMTANGMVYARSTDVAGNTSVESSYAVTNIDKSAPSAATFVADKTNPTNGNVNVTITYPTDAQVKQYKIGEAGVWTTYTAPVVMTTNGTIFARSSDISGNQSPESNYVVSNIDKTAPSVATFTADTTLLTNGNVTVTITFPSDSNVKEYKVGASGTWMTYNSPVAVTTNGTIFARSSDAANNQSVESSYVVNNIDKNAPSSPNGVVTDNKLTISPGTDASGIKETRYQLNGGEWIVYSGVVTLPVGNHSINVKSIDNAGNESSVFNLNAEVKAPVDFSLATKAVENAEANPSQALVDIAQGEIDKLPASVQRTDLQERLDQVKSDLDTYNSVQEQIDDMNEVIDSGGVTLQNLEAYKNKINELRNIVSTLPNTMNKAHLNEQLDEMEGKLQLIETVLKTKDDGDVTEVELGDIQDQIDQLPDGGLKDQLQDELNQAKDLQDAINKVEKAEQSKNQEDIDTARDAVDKLPDGQVKDELNDRLDEVQKEVDAAKELADKIADATAKVEKAEESKSQSDVDTAREAVNQLPEGAIKDDLNDRLDAIQKQIDDAKANPIETAVKKAEASKSQVDVNDARDLVNTLPDGAEKNAYHERLDAVDAALKAATAKTRQAELMKRNPYISDAQTMINGLKDSPSKELLQERLDAVTKQIEDQLYADLLEKATFKVGQAEKYKHYSYVRDGWELVNQLREGAEKQALVDRLKAVEEAIAPKPPVTPTTVEEKIQQIQDPTVKTAFTNFLNALQSAEKYKARTQVLSAIAKADAISTEIRTNPLYSSIFNELDARLTIVKNEYNAGFEQPSSEALSNAVKSVESYEKYKSSYYKKKAQDAVNALPDGLDKDQLQERINAV